MALSTPIITDFSAGELSRRLDGRIDIAAYYKGCKTLENMILLSQGGATMRPGTVHIGEAADSSKPVFLVPFSISVLVNYILEFTEDTIRIIKNHEYVESGGSPVEIVTTYDPDDLFALRWAKKENDMYLVHPSYQVKKLTWTSDTSWSFSTVSFTAGVSEEDFSTSNHYPSCVAFMEQRLILAATNTNPQTVWGSKVADYEDFTLGTNDDDAWTYTIAADDFNQILWLVPKDDLFLGTLGGEWIASGGGAGITPSNVYVRRQTTYGSMSMQAILINDVIAFWQRSEKVLREYRYSSEQEAYYSQDLTSLADHIAGTGIVDMAFQRNPDPILWCVREDGSLIGLTYDRVKSVVGWHRHELDGKVESIAIIPGTKEDEIYVSVRRDIGGAVKRIILYFTPRDQESHYGEYYLDTGALFDGGPWQEIESFVAQTGSCQFYCRNTTIQADDYIQFENIDGNDALEDLNSGTYQVLSVSNELVTLKTLSDTWADYELFSGSVRIVSNASPDLTHLEGETVDIVLDGSHEAQQTVSSGVITIGDYYNRIHVGIKYTGIVEPMRIETGGMIQGKRKRIPEITIRFYKTRGAKAGPDEDNLQDIIFRQSGDPLDEAVPLYTGDKVVKLGGGYSRDGYFMIAQEQPLPMTVLAIMPKVEVEG